MAKMNHDEASLQLAADSLKKMGYTNVVSIEGGLKAWKAEQLPTDKS